MAGSASAAHAAAATLVEIALLRLSLILSPSLSLKLPLTPGSVAKSPRFATQRHAPLTLSTGCVVKVKVLILVELRHAIQLLALFSENA
jgi:hypothetical protein